MAEFSERAGELNITMRTGVDFNLPMTWRDETNSLVNLTGFGAAMQIRWSPNDTGTPLLSLTDGAGITLGGAAGTIDIKITDTQNAFIPGVLYYDLIMTDTAGDKIPLVAGTITVKPKVTL